MKADFMAQEAERYDAVIAEHEENIAWLQRQIAECQAAGTALAQDRLRERERIDHEAAEAKLAADQLYRPLIERETARLAEFQTRLAEMIGEIVVPDCEEPQTDPASECQKAA